MSLSNQGMDSYEEDCETEVAVVNFHEKMYYGSDIKKFLKKDEANITKLRMKEICWREYFNKRDKLLGSAFVQIANNKGDLDGSS